MAHINRVLRSFRNRQILHLEKHCVTILDLEYVARLAQSTTTAPSPADLAERLVSEPTPLKGQPIRNDVIPDPGDRPCAAAFALSQPQASSDDGTARGRGEDHVLAISLPR